MSKFIQYIGTRTFRRNLIIAIVLLGLFVFLIFFVLRAYTRHGEVVQVPALTGKQVEEAISIIEKSGFKYQVDSVYQMDQQPGLVIDQDPVAQSKVKENRTIYLTIINRTAPTISFPELRELTFLEAKAIIQNYGLRLGDTIYIPDIARDRVLDVKLEGQKLNEGQEIPKGTEIALVLGNGMGDAEVNVPDLSGLTLSEATFSIKGSSLTLGTVRYMGYITDTAGARVISQTPAADTTEMGKVSIGTPVNLALSN